MNTQTEKQALHSAPPPAPLSPRLAFVVQFRASSSRATKSYTGRAEHMTSGRTALFRSQAQLWTFLTQVLAEEEQRSQGQKNLSHLRPERLPDEER